MRQLNTEMSGVLLPESLISCDLIQHWREIGIILLLHHEIAAFIDLESKTNDLVLKKKKRCIPQTDKTK